MTESSYNAVAINYEIPFNQEDLQKYAQSNGYEYTNALAPCFSGESIEELFYCDDHFCDAMQALDKPFNVYFTQWKLLLHGLAKGIWLEVIGYGDPKDNEAPYDENEDGFIKVTE